MTLDKEAQRGWDANAAIAQQPLIPWRGSAWRAHRRKYEATDCAGALRSTGRYNRGADVFPLDEVFPVLYLALAPEITLGEIVRRVTPERLSGLNEFRISELRIVLSAALDIRNPAALGLPVDALWHDTDFAIPQALAAAARERGAEGIIVSSATRLGDNLIVFPDRLQAASELVVVASRDPRLYAERT
jgi:RES domain-containing protein